MRYPGCWKAKAFTLFDKGMKPSQIYGRIKVEKHTLYCYYQLWKKEHAEESHKKVIGEESQWKLNAERRSGNGQQKLGNRRKPVIESRRDHERSRLEAEYEKQKELVLALEAQMETVPNIDSKQRIGVAYSREYDKFRELTTQLFPGQADDESIEMALHPGRGGLIRGK